MTCDYNDVCYIGVCANNREYNVDLCILGVSNVAYIVLNINFFSIFGA